MQYHILFLFVVLVASLIYPSNDAIAQRKPHDSIASLTPYIGHWEGKMDAYEDRPPGTLRVSCKSIGGGNYLQFNTSFTPQGSEHGIDVENVLVGFSGRTNSPHAWCFAHAAQGDSDIKIDGTRVTIKDLTYIHADGNESVRTMEYALEGEDQYVVRITNVRHHGKGLPDWPTLTLSRKQ